MDVERLTSILTESLIPDTSLRRFTQAIVESIDSQQLVSSMPSSTPGSGTDPHHGDAPTPEEMRSAALDNITEATGHRPRRTGRGSAQTYSVGSGPPIYLRTRARDERSHDHQVYWFGLRPDCWKDPNAWFVLQCDLDFAVVVQVRDWLPYKDQIGQTQKDERQPHVHRDGNRVELRESTGLRLDVSQWVDNWDQLAAATRSTPL